MFARRGLKITLVLGVTLPMFLFEGIVMAQSQYTDGGFRMRPAADFASLIRVAPAGVQSDTVTVEGDGFEVSYEDVTYVSDWPPESSIRRWIAVKNTTSGPLFLNFTVTCLETGMDISPFPQPNELFLQPGESQKIRYFLDLSWRTGLGPNSPPGEYPFTTKVEVFPAEDRSKVLTVYLHHLVRLGLEDFTPNAVVYGRVYDENARPFPPGIIQIHLNGAGGVPQYSTIAGEGGHYSIPCWAGRYQMSSEVHRYILSVDAPGYKAFNRVLEPQEGDSIKVNIYLKRATDNASFTLKSSYNTNLTIFRGDVTADERYFVVSHAHMEGFTDDEMHQRASIYYFSMDGELLWSRFIGNEVWGIDLSDDGSYVAAAIMVEDKIILLDRNGTELWNTADLGYGPLESREVRISHNNQYVAVGATGRGFLNLLRLADGSLVWGKTLGAGQIRQIQFSPDDQYIYIGNGDGFLYKLDINGNLIWRTDIQSWPYTYGLIITPDEAYIATATKMGRTSFIDGSIGDILWSFDTGSGAWVDIAPDASFVVVGTGGPYGTAFFDRDGNLRWWKGVSESGMITDDGKYILISSQNIELRDTNGRLLWSYSGGQSRTHFSYITRDGSKIVAGTADGRVCFFQGGIVSSAAGVSTSTPQTDLLTHFSLEQNYPNPFNSTTTIRYYLPYKANVLLEVYNVMGQRVAVLADGKEPRGERTVRWDAGHLASGIYLYRLRTDGFREVRKALLLR